MKTWMHGFSEGFFNLLHTTPAVLVGGDMTQGPMSITVSVQGLVPENQAIKRGGAQVGDKIYMTGELGAAGLAYLAQAQQVSLQQEVYQAVLPCLQTPTPRMAEGIVLREYASAAIDVSDGIAADLAHILEASQCGARLQLDVIPMAQPLQTMSAEQAWSIALTSGDDYELCFTVPVNKAPALEQVWQQDWAPLTCIGEVIAGKDIHWCRSDGTTWIPERQGYQHFAPSLRGTFSPSLRGTK